MDISQTNHPESQALLNILKTQHFKIETTLKGSVFHSKYLAWRYIYEMNKFKPLFDILLAQYKNLNEYSPTDDIKRALEAYFINYFDVSKKPTASINNITANNNTTNDRKRKRNKNKNKSNKSFS
jgi:hypothetical protein